MALSSKNSATSINHDENGLARQNSILSSGTPVGKRQRANSGISLQTMSGDDPPRTPNPESESEATDDELSVALHYAGNRTRQEKLLLVTNLFRLLVVVILAFVIYFRV